MPCNRRGVPSQRSRTEIPALAKVDEYDSEGGLLGGGCCHVSRGGAFRRLQLDIVALKIEVNHVRLVQSLKSVRGSDQGLTQQKHQNLRLDLI